MNEFKDLPKSVICSARARQVVGVSYFCDDVSTKPKILTFTLIVSMRETAGSKPTNDTYKCDFF